MFSRDVKCLSFRCQTLKFPRPHVKFTRWLVFSWFTEFTVSAVKKLTVRFFGRILKRICDLSSFGTDESLSRVDFSVPLLHHDPNNLRSQIHLGNAPWMRKSLHLYKTWRFSSTFLSLGDNK